jgi:hypothetical protein
VVLLSLIAYAPAMQPFCPMAGSMRGKLLYYYYGHSNLTNFHLRCNGHGILHVISVRNFPVIDNLSSDTLNSFSRNCFLFALSNLLFASCAKNTTNTGSNSGTNTNVYVAGDNGTNPVLWKNGTPEILSSTMGPASQVILSGRDVYVAGSDVYVGGSSINDTAVYWKHDISTTLQSSIAGAYVTSVTSIFVSGTDVYATANLIVPTNGGVMYQRIG